MNSELGLLLDSELSNEEFQFNEHDVCLNPTTEFYFMPSNALAWAYLEIKVCNVNGLWTSGTWTLSGCSPCMKPQEEKWYVYKTKEEAIQKSITTIKDSFVNCDIVKNLSHYKKAFQEYLSNRNQLSLF